VTLLVTGAGGFVGLNVLERALAAGESVLAVDAGPLFRPAVEVFGRLPGTLEVVLADVRSREAVREAFAGRTITRVIHGAAITLGPASTIAPADAVIDVNVLGTRNVLEAAAEAGVSRFVYPSSSAVYGAAPFEGRPVTEETEARPTGIYGFTKLASERLLLAAQKDGVMDVAIGRVTAVFGAWEHETGVRETLSPPFQLAAEALSGSLARMPEGGARDWTSSRDVAAALLALAGAPRLKRRIHNISLGETWHPSLLASALAARLGRPVAETAPAAEATIAFNDDATAVRSPVDAGRIRADLGVTFMSPAEAVEDYADWVLAHGLAALGRA